MVKDFDTTMGIRNFIDEILNETPDEVLEILQQKLNERYIINCPFETLKDNLINVIEDFKYYRGV